MTNFPFKEWNDETPICHYCNYPQDDCQCDRLQHEHNEREKEAYS